MESKPIHGLHRGHFSGQHDRVDELNERITNRSFDNMPIKPVYDPRSVSTKYSQFHILDRRTKFTPTYLDDKEPVGENVEMESDLYGRKERIGVYDSGSKFKPALDSDLYKVIVGNPMDNAPPAERALLFQKFTFDKHVHQNVMNQEIGRNIFYNHTRTQLRNTNW
jgi:hypothetical protein